MLVTKPSWAPPQVCGLLSNGHTMTGIETGKKPAKDPRPLAEVARDYKRGTVIPRELFDAFVAAPLYWPAPPQPGVPVVLIEGHPVAPVFSSEAEMAKLVGETRWLSTDGLRFLSLLPPGVTIGLDLASPHRLRLDPAAVRLEYALVLPGGNEGDTTPGPSRTEEH
jgi:hypothetical protein